MKNRNAIATSYMANKNVLKKETLGGRISNDWQSLLMMLPGVLYFIVFKYIPMFGLIIAFKNYGIYLGFLKSEWVGLKHFIDFFFSDSFMQLFSNTLTLGIMSLIFEFPIPIIFALLLNEVNNARLKKLAQTASFMPSLLSVVVVCSMFVDMLSPSTGIINRIITALGGEAIYFVVKPEWFRAIYISSNIWASMGFGAIVYMAAISGVDTQLYDAAKIDGCGRFRCMFNVTLPGIIPTVATMLILKTGSILKVGADKILLLYNPATYGVADVFSTFVYRKGMVETNYSYGTAVGLFESLVCLILVLISNRISNKMTETSVM